MAFVRSFVVVSIAFATNVLAASSLCPFNYPSELNNTESGNGLVFTIASNNPVINNRAVQLRPNPFFEGGFFCGIDAQSPVLLANFREGGFYSQARNQINQLYDLGPTGYLNQRDGNNGTTRFSFAFANATQWPGEVDKAWMLTAGSSTGTYSLFHDVDEGLVNGFLICEAEIDLENGPWYQLFYTTSSDSPGDFPGCESVGLSTTVAPTIYNGACDIGGYVGS
ncbi:hypothetical protein DL771_002523 [Monosporascus sp. 5C6A]|nr:hypothetical protein DL771_002523 [Monosporascus sp. 5C6A]